MKEMCIQKKLYIVGVGPGDPELMTLKAARIMMNADVIAFPAGKSSAGIAYHIAEQAIPELSRKELLPLEFPMIKTDLTDDHHAAAGQLQAVLQTGKSVALLTLGDPGFYSTPYHILDLMLQNGYPVEIISGVTSFSAASARLQIPLASGDESVLITPGEFCDFPGIQVILKAGSRLDALKEKVRAAGKNAYLIENCGMENEKVYSGIESLPAKTDYLSILIVR